MWLRSSTEEQLGPNEKVEGSNPSEAPRLGWMCRLGFHQWVTTVFKVLMPECGGAVPAYYEIHCEWCGKQESGSSWF